MKTWLRDYGAGVILAFFLVVTSTAYWHQSYAASRAEAEEHGQVWEKSDQRTRFWDGVWENDRSEYEQLFIQFLLMVAFADYVTRKQQKSMEEAVQKVLEQQKK